MTTKVYMTLTGDNLFLATEVFFMNEAIVSETSPEEGSHSWFTIVNQVYESAGYLVEFDLGDGYWDISHGRVFKKEALLRKAYCLGEL